MPPRVVQRLNAPLRARQHRDAREAKTVRSAGKDLPYLITKDYKIDTPEWMQRVKTLTESFGPPSADIKEHKGSKPALALIMDTEEEMRAWMLGNGLQWYRSGLSYEGGIACTRISCLVRSDYRAYMPGEKSGRIEVYFKRSDRAKKTFEGSMFSDFTGVHIPEGFQIPAPTMCFACDKDIFDPNVKLLDCACGEAAYCSKACQQLDWDRLHKGQCPWSKDASVQAKSRMRRLAKRHNEERRAAVGPIAYERRVADDWAAGFRGPAGPIGDTGAAVAPTEPGAPPSPVTAVVVDEKAVAVAEVESKAETPSAYLKPPNEITKEMIINSCAVTIARLEAESKDIDKAAKVAAAVEAVDTKGDDDRAYNALAGRPTSIVNDASDAIPVENLRGGVDNYLHERGLVRAPKPYAGSRTFRVKDQYRMHLKVCPADHIGYDNMMVMSLLFAVDKIAAALRIETETKKKREAEAAIDAEKERMRVEDKSAADATPPSPPTASAAATPAAPAVPGAPPPMVKDAKPKPKPKAAGMHRPQPKMSQRDLQRLGSSGERPIMVTPLEDIVESWIKPMGHTYVSGKLVTNFKGEEVTRIDVLDKEGNPRKLFFMVAVAPATPIA